MMRRARRSKGLAAAEDDEKPSKVAGRRKLHKPGENPGPLPAPVEEMRQAILAAAHSGNIDDLRVPLDWNELKPEVAAARQRGPDRLLEEDIGATATAAKPSPRWPRS